MKNIIAIFFTAITVIVRSMEAVVLDLPNTVPGIMADKQNQTINEEQNIECFHIIVPNSEADYALRNHHMIVSSCNTAYNSLHNDSYGAMAYKGNIYFPTNGIQPTTKEAAKYSCANVLNTEDSPITEWYIRVFGGEKAVIYSKNQVPTSAQKTQGPKLGFKENNSKNYIITAYSSSNVFKQQFWKTFRTIASDPVGRVLLYRILIEIRRQVSETNKNGPCEPSLLPQIDSRKRNRSIVINYSHSLCFIEDQGIDFDYSNNTTTVLKIHNHQISNEFKTRTSDIGLFHEMLHWFHLLRYPDRFTNDSRQDNYQYLTRCYYGDISELFVWEGDDDIVIDNEEIRTILGTPDYTNKKIRKRIPKSAFFKTQDRRKEPVIDKISSQPVPEHYVLTEQKFLNGDDLSENTYRMSKHNSHIRDVRMRWGHGGEIKPLSINPDTKEVQDTVNIFNKNRFILGNMVARNCYSDITGNDKIWNLGNEATEP